MDGEEIGREVRAVVERCEEAGINILDCADPSPENLYENI